MNNNTLWWNVNTTEAVFEVSWAGLIEAPRAGCLANDRGVEVQPFGGILSNDRRNGTVVEINR